VNASTTKLSLDYLRGLGYVVDVVERWVPAGAGGPQVRRDLFGILDLVAIRGDETLGVQTTTKGELSRRARKIAESEHVAALREAGWRLVIHGWWQPGGPRTRYALEEVDVS
jgi:hypothetical protein